MLARAGLSGGRGAPADGATQPLGDRKPGDRKTVALVSQVRDTGGITRDELTASVARRYGWTRRGPDSTARLHAPIDRLLAEGTLAGHANNLSVARRR